MTVSIRLTPQDEDLFRNYAKTNNISLSELFRNAVLEKIEDDYDARIAEEAYMEYLNSGCKSTPASEFWKEIDEEI